ncbi:MAG: DUF58 domain-containing protein [Ruminococcus sp.]|nr:DUF58 domain-containing protein [Ruminococcus sp.]
MMRTIWMKIIYFILLLAAALFSVLYLEPFSILLLLILLLIPILMLLSNIYIRFHLRVSLQLTGSTYHRGTPQAVQLTIRNSGFLPVGRAVASINWISMMSDTKIPVSLTFPIPARNVTTVEFRISASHCGLTKMRMQWMQFTDYIHLFGWKMHVHPEAELLVLPGGKELDFPLSVPGSETDEESNIYSKLKPGDDPSEVYRIREYQPGDLQKRIHWKLSCRTDTVWVKEYSFPIQHRAAVVIDYSCGQTASAAAMDTALEAAFTLCAAFVRQEIPLMLYWLDAASGQLVWNELHTPSDLNDCFGTLLRQLPAKENTALLEQLSEQPALRSTNAIWYCTPCDVLSEMQKLSGIFKENRLHVLTARKADTEEKRPEHIYFIDEGSVEDTLRGIYCSGEVMS